MARIISEAAREACANPMGEEPIIVVVVTWSPGFQVRYGSRQFPDYGIQGKILEVSAFDDVVNINTGSNTSSVQVKLDDTDGSIKGYFDAVDVHKIPVTVYQWFSRLNFDQDAFVLFSGYINSPIVWKEGDRTFEFEIVDKIEDNQIGFSVEDGQFANVPQEMVGKPWPMPFGTVINSRTLQLDRIPTGATKVATGIIDRHLQFNMDAIDCESGKQLAIAACLSLVGADLQFDGTFGGQGQEVYDKGSQFQQRATDIRNQVGSRHLQDKLRLSRIQSHQGVNYDLNPIPIFNGFKFLQNVPVGILIGQTHYYGVFEGDFFHVISYRGPNDPNSRVPYKPGVISNVPTSDSTLPFPFGTPAGGGGIPTPSTVDIVFPSGDFIDRFYFGNIGDNDFYTSTDQDRKEDPCGPRNLLIFPDARCSPNSLSRKNQRAYAGSNDGFIFNQAGTSVKPTDVYPIRYIVSIIPGTVLLGIAAMRSFGGQKELIAVPTDYYTVSEVHYGTLTTLVVTVVQPLSSIPGEDWSNEVFATVVSPVGPNTADILKYLIQRWAPGFGIDTASFNDVRTHLEPFPSNFTITDRPNILQALKDIAYQCRCAIYVKNGVVFFKYLPKHYAGTESITENDVISKSLEVTTTRTEDIVTQYIGLWKGTGFPSLQQMALGLPFAAFQPVDNKLILQNNVPKYGLVKREVNYYIYNDESLVEKSVLFWMSRLSNQFKLIKFKTFLSKITIETFDTITLNFSHNYVSIGEIDAIVQKASYDSNSKEIEIECWVPVLLGTMTQYENAMPADNEFSVWGEIEEEAGTFGPNQVAHGDLAGVGVIYNVTTAQNQKPRRKQTGDVGFQTPDIITTIANYAPAGITTGGSGIQQGIGPSTPQPRYDTTYSTYKELDRPRLGFAGGAVPSKVGDYVGFDEDSPNAGSQIYKVLAYVDGLNKPPTTFNATQIDQDPTDTLPPGTWVMVHRQTYVSIDRVTNKPSVKFKYYMSAPVWMDFVP